jgi:hypothetical protein
MKDAFADHTVGLTAPASHAESVVPNDSADLTHATRGLFVGQSGNVRVRTSAGDIVTLANMQGGVLYPVRVVRIFQTGTTASDIVGLS